MLSRSRSVLVHLERGGWRNSSAALHSLVVTGRYNPARKEFVCHTTDPCGSTLHSHSQSISSTTSSSSFPQASHVPASYKIQDVSRTYRYTNDDSNKAMLSVPTRLFSTCAEDDINPTEKEQVVSPTFESLEDLESGLKAALSKKGLTHMTPVQYETWEAASTGVDVLARARTGTGKTVAFLLPAIQQLINRRNRQGSDETAGSYTRPKGIEIVVLSPTRELASQIHEQAEMLIGRLSLPDGSFISSQVIYGGVPRDRDVIQFKKRSPTILVATPGRLKDHLQNTILNGSKYFSESFKSVSIFILDETDRMLDMGFKAEVEEIMSYVPKDRQTLLFSATVPNELRSVMAAIMKEDFVTVDCIGQGSDDSDHAEQHTNSQVAQSYVVLKENTRMITGAVEILMNLIQSGTAETPVKMIVFFPTSYMTEFYAALFNNGLNIPVMELHSKKSQPYRTNVAKRFRSRPSGILFTTDVSARGVDYPDVTHVVQIGMPADRESYIHRLGRTGRAGKVGTGLLVLTTTEEVFLKSLEGISVPLNTAVQAQLDVPPSDAVMAQLRPIFQTIGNDMNSELSQSATKAYRSILGYYKTQLPRLGKTLDDLVYLCNQFALQSGFSTLPPFDERIIVEMGLGKARGLNIVQGRAPFDRQQNFGGRERFGDARGYGGRSSSGRRHGGDYYHDRGQGGGGRGQGRWDAKGPSYY